MIEQIAFYGACLAIYCFFRLTTGRQRHRAFTITLWIILAFGTLGFLAEVWMRGGALPITG